MRTFDEYTEDKFSYVEKEEGGTSRMVVKATVQHADTVNRNARLYPRDVLDAAMKAYKLKIPKGRSYGTLDHSPGLRDSSHLITDLRWNEKDPNKMDAEILILNTTAGKNIRELIRGGGRPGISSRGKGDSSLEKRNGKQISVIQKNFRFDSFDVVADPSVRAAGIKKILKEARKDELEDLIVVVKRKAKKEGGFGSEVNRMRRT